MSAVLVLKLAPVYLHQEGQHAGFKQEPGRLGRCAEAKVGRTPATRCSAARVPAFVEGPQSVSKKAQTSAAFRLPEPSFPSLEEHRGDGAPLSALVPACSTLRGRRCTGRRHLSICAAVEEEAQPATANAVPDLSSRCSVSDEQYAQEGILFSTSSEDVDLLQLNDLFSRVGFPRRDVTRLTIALKNTFLVMSVYERRQSSGSGKGRLIGFARATSDGVFHATIWDVAVDPRYQKRGIGKALMERMLLKLRSFDISSITLFSEPNVVAFYKLLGFVTDPSGIRAMALSKNTFKLPL